MNQTEADMKHVGFFGIFKHSFKTIFKWTRIFTLITLTCILPLTIIFLLHMELSHHLFRKIENSSLPFDTNDNNENDKNATALDWFYYLLFEVIYLILLSVFSLLATSTVVFTIASIYTNKEVVFCNVLKAVPKVSKRLFVTFALIYITFFVYSVIGSVVIAIITAIYRRSPESLLVGNIIMIIFIIIYLVGFLYLSVVWQLASVITVLENLHGCKAMKKGKFLANGKKKIGMAIAFVLYIFLIGLLIVYYMFVEYGHEVFKWALIWRVLMGILCGLLLLMWFLVLIVTQTFLYLVCKSYHREAIDKLSLSTFLGAYTGETTVRSPKPGDEIPLGRTQVQSDASQQV